ncbi:hypothetical protein GCM10010112_23390 [Actinoplanes lobatus]|uniref:Uncharacterized protein n=1 Tax=Actinoplanes lobatus TaxID=113568 RepID=A0A7W7MIG4_9ACTN|nr:DUF6615 family protein [Actinoplanes lobatus]MBB4751381.1 hypothetical protein [Actinoplanes lobatus]GGN63798.1 hypothetical protein GCM10010112_23390 [Actinoplanes lobatus]GIE40990.1 hypothetical protein Alo02nite_38880 [Actinoplanes lobatus]
MATPSTLAGKSVPTPLFAWALKSASIAVHRDMTDSRKFGISRFEETSTQQSLLSIARSLPHGAAYTLERGGENLTGADWLWEIWFVGGRCLGIRIQAKRLYANGVYKELGHRIAATRFKKSRLQVDVLIEQCRMRGLVPAYVFYNDSQIDSCTSVICPMSDGFPENLGATFAHAREVRDLILQGKKRVEDVARISKPWCCMIRPWRGVCCRGSHHEEPFWSVALDKEGSFFGGPGDAGADLAQSVARAFGVPEDSGLLRDAPPPEIQRLMEPREGDRGFRWPRHVAVTTILTQHPRPES